MGRRSTFLGVSLTNVTLAERARLLRTHFKPHMRLQPKPAVSSLPLDCLRCF